MKPILINIYGAPSSGKTVFATTLYTQLAVAGYDVGYVSEVAKTLYYIDALKDTDQTELTGMQAKAILGAIKEHDIIVTDAPNFSGVPYGADIESCKEKQHLIEDITHKFDFYLPICSKEYYAVSGRSQSYEESKKISDILETDIYPIVQWIQVARGAVHMIAYLLPSWKGILDSNLYTVDDVTAKLKTSQVLL